MILPKHQYCRCVIPQPNWLTPTVISLAKEALENTLRECPACRGTGRLLGFVPKSYNSPCHYCGSTGKIRGSGLDLNRLAVLHDALIDAGCNDENLLQLLIYPEGCLTKLKILKDWIAASC